MATFVKVPLSGSVSGSDIRPILVDDNASPGKTIHTADATAYDEVWIYAYNSGTSAVKLTLEWGVTTSPIEQTISPEAGLVLVAPGLLASGGDVIAAFAANATDVSIVGYVNRIE